MSFTVFYAWQSDREERSNHYLIRDALQDAIDAVVADLRIEEAPEVEPDDSPAQTDEQPPIELDWATKDEPGTPNVAQTIFRKISECGVFLADLTFVAGGVSADGRQKFLPNSNVMIELGLASASVGWTQTLLVMNKHYGGPEHLPFDLKNYAYPVTFELAPGADKKTRDAARKGLAKALETKLRIMQKRGVWTKKGEEEERQREAQRESLVANAEELKREFGEALIANEWHMFRAKRGIVAVTIVPLMPEVPLLPLNDQFAYKHMADFAPINAEGSDPEPVIRSMLYRYTRHDEFEEMGLTEVTQEGCVFSVEHWIDTEGSEPSRQEVVQIPMWAWEPCIVRAIGRYLRTLKNYKVGGPWFVNVQLIGVQNFQLLPRKAPSPRSLKPPCKKHSILPDNVIIHDNINLNDDQVIAQQLKHPLDQIWRSFGHMRATTFSEQGRYWPLERQ